MEPIKTRIMDLVFATNNPHKIQEVNQLLKPDYQVCLLGLKDIGCNEELPETGNTLEKNALQKARYIFKNYHFPCFADDTGLEVEALGGKPGTLSARYAGGKSRVSDTENNIRKVLNEMQNIKNRAACFRTIIALIINNKEFLFEGAVNGIIADKPRGKNGFGYDPVFIPEGFGYPLLRSNKSFSEMSAEEKNKISHRSIAVKKLAGFLNSISPFPKRWNSH